jgi:hypothetical protein
MKSHVRGRSRTATWPERALAIALLSAVALAFMLAIAAVAPAAAPARLPEGVPDVESLGAPGEWRVYQGQNLQGNPDFPLLMFVNNAGRQPAAVLMVLDAQNGTQQWSMTSDPIIMVALFADPETVTRVYCDAGFLQAGRASGEYAPVSVGDLQGLATFLSSLVPVRDPSGAQPRAEAGVGPQADPQP